MNTSTQFISFTAALRVMRLGLTRLELMRVLWPTLRRISTLVLLFGSIAGPIALLRVQNVQAQDAAPSPVKAQNAPSTLPTAPSESSTKLEAADSVFSSYQRQTQLPFRTGYGFDLSNPSFINPFQPAVNFSGLPGSTGAPPFNRMGSFGTTRRGVNGFNQPGSFGMGRSQADPGSLFQPSSATGGPFGITPQPSLNQLMRGSFNLPLGSSSTSAIRFQYSSVLTSTGNLNDFAHPYSSTLFTSSDLGNGVFLSAGTYNSGHSTAGSLTMPSGSNSGAPKHSSSGVAIKLSF